MTITVDAVFENGVLKPLEQLPLKDNDGVRLTVQPLTSWVEQTYGMLRWHGDAATLDRLIDEAEDCPHG